MVSDIEDLLRRHTSLKYDSSSNKVRCALSGHEMPYKEDAIRSYVNGKKYIKLKERDDKNFEKYKPHLVPSSKKYHEHQLFCVLTMTHVNKTPAHVERHVNGTKYKRRVKLWLECKRTGQEYRPPKGRRKVVENQDLRKGVSSTEDGAAKDDEEEISDTDSLSDLYPGGKAPEEDDEAEAGGSKDDIDVEDEDTDDSDFEFEQLEEPKEEPKEEQIEQKNVKQESSKTKSESLGGQKCQGAKQNKKKRKKQKLS